MVTLPPVRPGATGCIVCHSSTELRFARVKDPQTGTEFSIERCTSCGLGRTTPVPDDPSRYYGDVYYRGRHGVTDRYCSWRRCRLVARAVPRGGALLDVGCGDGAFMAAAHGKGWSVTGVEIDHRARAEASEAGLSVVPALSDLPIAARFDAITLWHSLEHFDDPAGAIAHARSLLADEGALLVAVPDAGGSQAMLFGPRWFHLDVPRHLFHYTQRALERLLSGAGFQVERWYHQEVEYDVFGWIQSAINSVTATPNNVFSSLTGKPHRATLEELAFSYAAALALAPAAMTATAVTSAMGRGGTLIAVARPKKGNAVAL